MNLRHLIGHGLAVIGIGCLVAAGWLGWAAWSRGQGVRTLYEAVELAARGQAEPARQRARQAGLEGEPAAELLGADLHRPDDLVRLSRAMAGASPAERDILSAALALGRVLAGDRPGDEAPAADRRLLEAISIWRSGKDAPWPAIDRQDPPHRAVLVCAHESALARAVVGGRADERRRHAQALQLLDPHHPWQKQLASWASSPEPAVEDAAP